MTLGEPQIAGFLAAFVRTSAWLFAAPFVGDRGLPPRVRVAVAALIALPLAPLAVAGDFSQLLVRLPAELLFGLVGGFAARLGIAGAEAGGQLIGVQLELNFAGTLDPIAREETLPTRKLAWCLAGIAFLSLGGLERSIEALAVPADGLHLVSTGLPELIERGGAVLALGLRVAAPMMAAAVVSNLAVGLASRAAPAMNAFSVMLASILVIGALVLGGSAPSFAREISGDARLAGDAMMALVRR